MAINLTRNIQHAKDDSFASLTQSKHRGFALLVAIIFMSVMLSFGLSLGSLGYKQHQLSLEAVGSQYAFYAADAALECALYADQHDNLFKYTNARPQTAPSMTCNNAAPYSATITSHRPTFWIVTTRLSFADSGTCADVTVYKYDVDSGGTYIFAQGYNVPCATISSPGGARLVSRGIRARY